MPDEFGQNLQNISWTDDNFVMFQAEMVGHPARVRQLVPLGLLEAHGKRMQMRMMPDRQSSHQRRIDTTAQKEPYRNVRISTASDAVLDCSLDLVLGAARRDRPRGLVDKAPISLQRKPAIAL